MTMAIKAQNSQTRLLFLCSLFKRKSQQLEDIYFSQATVHTQSLTLRCPAYEVGKTIPALLS